MNFLQHYEIMQWWLVYFRGATQYWDKNEASGKVGREEEEDVG